MSGGIERRLERLSLIWSRPCAACANDEARLFVSVTPEEIEALAEQADENGDLPPRRCMACGRRLAARIYVGIDLDRV